MQKNKDQKNSENEHFLRNEGLQDGLRSALMFVEKMSEVMLWNGDNIKNYLTLILSLSQYQRRYA